MLHQEATRASLAKEDEKIRQLEAELKSLKRNSARREAEISEDEVARSSPVKKKKKKAVTIEVSLRSLCRTLSASESCTLFIQSKPSSPSTKKTKSSSRPVAATKSKVASKSILKPPPPPAQAEAGEDLDDFDTFPLPPKHVKPKVATQAPRKRPSLAGKQVTGSKK